MIPPLPGKKLNVIQISIVVLTLLSMVMFSTMGCGDNSDDKSSTNEDREIYGQLDRSEPGRVTVSDKINEEVVSGETPQAIPAWLDIAQVSIAKDGDNLVFETILAEPAPAQRPTGVVGIEWGYVIDINGDADPDFGMYLSNQSDVFSYGLFNPLGGERQADAEFPGSFTQSGNTLSWTLSAAAIGQPESFQWVAYTDAAANGGTAEQPKLVKAGDKVPRDGWPGREWLPFP